ncbi:hypothetical protein BSL78_10476, partial [Apostichopus japonicus]
LEHLVKKLKEENADLKQLSASQDASCGHTSRSTTPSPPSVDSSDSHYHYPRGRRKGSLLSGGRRPSPSLSTSTLTSPGEEVGNPHREVGRRLASRKRRTLTPQRVCTAEDEIEAARESANGLLVRGEDSSSVECEAKSASEEEETGARGNYHQVTVDVHRSFPHVEEETHNHRVHLQTEENLVKVLRTSVGIQCSLPEDLHRNLQRQLDEVVKEKAELGSSYLRVQQELEQLKLHVETLEKERRMKDCCIVEIENELMMRNIPHSEPLTKDSGLKQSLPRLTEPTTTTGCQKAVKSLSRITGGCTIHLEDRVMIKGDRTGRVCYIGPLKHLKPSMVFVGVQLESTAGRHDGSIHGHRYFTCPKNQGIFIPVQDVNAVLTSKFIKRPKSAKVPSIIPRHPPATRHKRVTPVVALPSSPPVKSNSTATSRPISSRRQTRLLRQQ